MNAKISVFVICVEAIIYLLLYNLHECTFKYSEHLREENSKNRNRQGKFEYANYSIKEYEYYEYKQKLQEARGKN